MNRPGKKRNAVPKFSIPDAQPPPTQDIAPANLESSALIVLEGQQFTVGADELETLEELGRGAYGIVERMRHKPTGTLMAVKRITFTLNENEKRTALMELNVSMKASCEYTVRFYGAFFREGDIWICMEVMDTSLDKFYKAAFAQCGEIPENVLGRISFSIVTALDYLKERHNIMHRDVKPSNVLINAQGAVKLCDFGISGHMVDSVAKSNLGCKPYMPPERIEVEVIVPYDVRSDVWSLGITMVELSIGRFPYPTIRNVFEQLKQVVQSEPPRLPPGKFSKEYEVFIELCLQKNRENRAKYRQLLDTEFLKKNKDNDIADFARTVISQMDVE
ncbi:dual specificity mitogen-activated protein kinase kinase 6 [Galendromus occidentalis]|uniref:mitogen-activated protein kinase kinase n=1 Tax=Galendromus occidentalis TaxID=34638 RepID=A0AAJ6QVM9_9ACAR|nr:dual specificity mitogen-activated protein kinase kinase 6 [Galendromus occidentalis]